MKTLAAFTGFLCMVSFLVFVWLSHTGVLPGDWNVHFGAGLGLFLLAIVGFWLTDYMAADDKDKYARWFTFSAGLLYTLNFVFFVFLEVAGLIGPFFVGVEPSNASSCTFLLGLFYFLLAWAGAGMMYFEVKERFSQDRLSE